MFDVGDSTSSDPYFGCGDRKDDLGTVYIFVSERKIRLRKPSQYLPTLHLNNVSQRNSISLPPSFFMAYPHPNVTLNLTIVLKNV
jgi:hypothetical protein